MPAEIIGALIALFSSLSTALLIYYLDTRRFETTRKWQEIDQKRKELIDTHLHRYSQVETCAAKVINSISKTREKFILACRDSIRGKQLDINEITSFLDRTMLFDEMAQLSVVIHAVGDDTLKKCIKDLNENFSFLVGWTETLIGIFSDQNHSYDKALFAEDEKAIDGLVNDCLEIYTQIYKQIDKLKHEIWKIHIET